MLRASKESKQHFFEIYKIYFTPGFLPVSGNVLETNVFRFTLTTFITVFIPKHFESEMFYTSFLVK